MADILASAEEKMQKAVEAAKRNLLLCGQAGPIRGLWIACR